MLPNLPVIPCSVKATAASYLLHIITLLLMHAQASKAGPVLWPHACHAEKEWPACVLQGSLSSCGGARGAWFIL